MLPVTREMQLRTTGNPLEWLLTQAKQNRAPTSVSEDVEKVKALCACQLVPLLWKAAGQFRKKLSTELPDDTAILPLGV